MVVDTKLIVNAENECWPTPRQPIEMLLVSHSPTKLDCTNAVILGVFSFYLKGNSRIRNKLPVPRGTFLAYMKLS